MIDVQVTIYDKKNRYRPISTILKAESKEEYLNNILDFRRRGVIKICQNKRWGTFDLKKYNYTVCRSRVIE